MRHHHDAIGRGAIVFRKDRAADGGRHAEDLEIIARHDLAHRQTRAVVQVQRREHRAVADDAVEHLVPGLQIQIVGIRGGAELDRSARVARKEIDKTIGRGHGQRLEEQRVDDRKERGVDADADRERGNRDHREPGTFTKPSKREPDVGQEGFEQDCNYNPCG